jgi:hypothetical protein
MSEQASQPDRITKRPVRVEGSVTSISWIPSEAISAMTAKLPFEMGMAHYDQPPPDAIEDLDALRRADRFRFANRLSGWIEVQDGRIVASGQSGGGMIGATTLRLGSRAATFQAVPLPDRHPEPTATETEVTFVQTAGGRTGVPTPRRVFRPPFVQIAAPLAWTTLSLTLRADGTVSQALVGASPFPRHWVYGSDGQLLSKSGVIDFASWYRRAFGKHSPWGDRDSPALTTEVETALERELSAQLMSGSAKPHIRDVKKGATITRQGDDGNELFLVLDGVVRIDVDGKHLAEYGPGSLHGERAILEGGKRTSTITAATNCKLAVATGDEVDRDALAQLSSGHRREDDA